jgi:hypothetical protein
MELIDALRSVRIFGIAVFDLLTSYLLAIVIGVYLIGLNRSTLWYIWLIWLFAWTCLGFIVHKALHINTTLGYYIGWNENPQSKPLKDNL